MSFSAKKRMERSRRSASAQSSRGAEYAGASSNFKALVKREVSIALTVNRVAALVTASTLMLFWVQLSLQQRLNVFE